MLNGNVLVSNGRLRSIGEYILVLRVWNKSDLISCISISWVIVYRKKGTLTITYSDELKLPHFENDTFEAGWETPVKALVRNIQNGCFCHQHPQFNLTLLQNKLEALRAKTTKSILKGLIGSSCRARLFDTFFHGGTVCFSPIHMKLFLSPAPKQLPKCWLEAMN